MAVALQVAVSRACAALTLCPMHLTRSLVHVPDRNSPRSGLDLKNRPIGTHVEAAIRDNIGRGKVIGRKCPHCDGHKVMDHTQHYTLEVPKGAPEGHEVVFEGEADESPDWEAGDVVLRIRSRKERGGWRRKESGLYWKETISVEEVRARACAYELVLIVFQALLGFERNLTHFDEHIVELKRTGVTQPGEPKSRNPLPAFSSLTSIPRLRANNQGRRHALIPESRIR